MFNYPVSVFVMLCAGAGAAIFEGGTIALLGLSVTVLTADPSSIPLSLPTVLAEYYQQLLHTISRGGIFLFLVGLSVGAQIGMSLLSYVSKIAQVNLAYKTQRDAQELATSQIMLMSYSEVSKYPAGRLATLVEQSGWVSSIVSEFGKAARACLMVLSYAVIMLMMSYLLTLSVLGITVGMWLVMTKLVAILKDLSRKSVHGEVDTWRWTVEFLNAPRSLRIFNNTGHAREVISEARSRRLLADRKSSVISSAIVPTFEVITVFGAGLFLVVGYLLAGQNAIEVVPKLFVFVLIFFRLKPQIKMVNDLRISLGKLLPRLELVSDFLTRKEKEFERTSGVGFNKFTTTITFSNVSFRYPGTKTNVLEDVNFSVGEGEAVALVGPSGAGKSTIVDLMLGLYSPTSGKILVDGKDLESLSLRDWRSRIGVVEQDTFLLNASVSDNIAFKRLGIDQAEVIEAAKVAHAHEFILDMSDGYATVVGDRGHKLSGGQQQRIALARALVHNPDLLFLDEATSSLDSISEKNVQVAIESMHRTRTLFVIAHRLATIDKADKIIVLENGKIVELGTKEELMSKEGIFFGLWELQMGEKHDVSQGKAK